MPSAPPTGMEGRSEQDFTAARRHAHRRGSMLLLLALGLGAAHAIQPGHGKTLVTAMALGPGARLYQPVLLGLATTVAHLGSVL